MQPGIYQHYKGKLYLVITSALSESDLTPLVVYQALYDDYTMWVRTEADFTQNVSIPEPHYTGPRFCYIRAWTQEDTQSHPKSIMALHQNSDQD